MKFTEAQLERVIKELQQTQLIHLTVLSFINTTSKALLTDQYA